jgi:NAD(P)-dependent dehydrogenase (short-subunit alcohol dehydrogenase family)
MHPQRSGCILFMAGTHGRQPRTYSVTAGVTNAALINASKVLAEAAAPFNIRVNAINPGPIDTERMVYLTKEKATELGIPEAEARRILADVTTAAGLPHVVASRASERLRANLEAVGLEATVNVRPRHTPLDLYA